MQVDATNDENLDAKIDMVLIKTKRVFLAFFALALVVAVVVLVLEVKREFSIDLIHGVNFSIDDWYFDNIAGN